MFEIIRQSNYVEKMYTIHGYIGDPSLNYTRYIQLSYYSGKPIIQSRFGYSAGRVICFESKGQAYHFINMFMNDPERKNKNYIRWDVIEYKPMVSSFYRISLRENDSKYGKYYSIYRFNKV